MNRMYNFNPGPAALPLEVLQEAQHQFVEFGNGGMSILEMSHRSEPVEQLVVETERLLLELLALPSGYRALFMGGGASTQFALIPLNFMKAGMVGGYVLSGSFSEKAYLEAKTIGKAIVLGSSKPLNWSRLPDVTSIQAGEDTAYIHMTANNTIEGSQFQELPDTGQVPLIADMTSDILSRKRDLSKLSMIYASAQKNLGPAGVTVALIREELLEQGAEGIPAIFRYATFAKHDSLYNTPPVHSIFMMKLVLQWAKRQGGVAELEKRNSEKAKLLYDVVDASGGFYKGVIDQPDRSIMNMTWRMQEPELEDRFLKESEQNGFAGLAGHRSVGGLRASAYNAVPVQACRALADFMRDFQKRNG